MAEKTAVSITVAYDDGSVSELEKGLVFRLTENPEEEQMEITAEMVSISGKDLYTIVHAVVELGMRLGIFKDLDREEDE